MQNHTTNTIFDRSGLARLSDLDSDYHKEIFDILEKAQKRFLLSEAEFRSPEYPWPRDPLHTWSRPWEYAYVYHHVRKEKLSYKDPRRPEIMDLGSGATFFPFALSAAGCSVTCVDNDPVCLKDMQRAAAAIKPEGSGVYVRPGSCEALPFDNSTFDILYCVSVIEHLPNIDKAVSEIHRVLRPGGLVVMTVDIGLRPDQSLDQHGCQTLLKAVKSHFYVQPDIDFTHPLDMLTSRNMSHEPKFSAAKRTRRAIRKILQAAGIVRPRQDYDLTVLGISARKK